MAPLKALLDGQQLCLWSPTNIFHHFLTQQKDKISNLNKMANKSLSQWNKAVLVSCSTNYSSCNSALLWQRPNI